MTYVGTAAVTAPDRLTPASFNGYATGTALHVSGLQSGLSRLANVDLAFSAAATRSNGLLPGISNEFGVQVEPTAIPLAGKTASGRGSGLELGLASAVPVDPNLSALALAGIAEATAPPNSPLVTKNIAIPVDPVVYAALVEGQAQAKFGDLLDQCPTTPLANPFGFGRGFAADAQLLNTAGTGVGGSFLGPVVATDANGQSVTETKSQVFPISNGDGTFGLRAVIESKAVPIRINLPPDTIEANDTIIEVGAASLTLTATGKPGGASVVYSAPPTPNVIVGGTPVISLPPIIIPIPGLLQVAIAEDPPHAIGNDALPPPVATNGTSVSAAVDGVRVSIPPVLVVPAVEPLVDLRVQHFEGSLTVPLGGFSFNDCGQIRITKHVVGGAVGPFTFHLDCPGVTLAATDADFTLADGASKIVSVPSTKVCTVTEPGKGTATSTQIVDGTAPTDDGTVTVPRNMGVVDVDVTNLNQGFLKVSKTAQSGVTGTFTFSATCTNSLGTVATTIVPATFTLANNESKTFGPMPGGTNCTVAETDPGNAAVTRITDSTAPNDDGKVLVAGGDTQTVTFSNAGPPLVIGKLATGESTGKGPFKFHLVCTDPTGKAIALDAADADFTLNSGQDHPIKKDMPDGTTCVVTEVDNGKATSTVPTDTSGSSSDATVTLKHGETQNVTFTNNFAPQIKLVVTKTVVGSGTGPFAFHVACTKPNNGGAVTLAATDANFTLSAGASKSIQSIPDGSTCTVTETDSKGATKSFSESSGTANDGVVTIPVDGAAQVGVTNTFVTPATVKPAVVQPRTVG